MDINDINAEIQRLKQERNDLINKDLFEKEIVIKSLEWTKDCTAKLVLNSFGGVGFPTYKIHVFGKCPRCIGSITIMGNCPSYEQNMMYGAEYGFDNEFCFYTSSKKMLLEFMDKVKFLKFDYNESDWEVLNMARIKSLCTCPILDGIQVTGSSCPLHGLPSTRLNS